MLYYSITQNTIVLLIYVSKSFTLFRVRWRCVKSLPIFIYSKFALKDVSVTRVMRAPLLQNVSLRSNTASVFQETKSKRRLPIRVRFDGEIYVALDEL